MPIRALRQCGPGLDCPRKEARGGADLVDTALAVGRALDMLQKVLLLIILGR